MLLVSHLCLAQNAIEALRMWPSPDNTRVVLDLTKPPEYSYFTLSNPERLVIDLANTKGNIDLANLAKSSDLVKKVRYSTPKEASSVRVVLELKRKLNTEIFALPPTAPYKNRLVIDLSDQSEGSQQVVMSSESSTRDRDIIIAIDAGHGGEDPGSIGRAGTYEKNITLSVSKRLAQLINGESGLRAVLTRTGDYYISPNARPDIARKNKADLFVSIHADAFTTPQPKGASVWVLSMGRANSVLGRWMERTERHSELLGGAAEVIQDTASERYLAQALLDMSMDHSLTTSYDISKMVISELKQVTSLHKKLPQAASLAVLTSPDIPSILVEIGFISNPKEEKNLNWSQHRQKLASSVFSAIKQHFRKLPPDGTLWASNARSEKRTHKVRSGESLSLLAQRYKVRISAIKEANNMRNDTVRIGQVLTIPST
ncbi:N-acetylmuramoyl-L-alanine amidase [Aliiglaciecola sp. 3_MG-2023]|uniref:N-acetylmuramoyl-L-alanine amidase n=1 Tax=Aliiglaciecola sp. 3_MG-2023 TaxID=3062644 RepID=UPI0026E24CA0|nr:N-acetylmuramoyl-L-alanine amidase [Aliiglaciecola sp. 3_MG-2023]MDO6694868.1 N-acetylmuramoyl-L-alanine amidase [Aliiglaciecola sp. 3_MG-2023]